jgi:hypothetical protein
MLLQKELLVGAARFELATPLRPRKTNQRYVIGPLSSALRPAPWFSMVFGHYWTQIGPKFLPRDLIAGEGSRELLWLPHILMHTPCQ